MTGVFPYRRPEPDEGLIRASLPVSTMTWTQTAGLANWVRGKGAMLIPWTFPDVAVTSGATDTFRFRVKTRSSAVERIWGFILITTTSGVTAEIAAPSGGSARTVNVLPTTDLQVPQFYTEVLASKAASEVELTCTVKAVGGNVTVAGICCYEQDRPILNEDATDLGLNVASCGAQQPILAATYASAQGVANIVGSGTDLDGRRAGLMHLVYGATGTSQTATGYSDMLLLAMPVLAAKLYRSSLTGTIKWSVYARVAGGAGGNVRLTAASGATSTFTITNTTAAWATAQSIDVDCEDMDSADGRQTAGTPAWDTLQVALQGDGTNALTVYSVSVWEDWS